MTFTRTELLASMDEQWKRIELVASVLDEVADLPTGVGTWTVRDTLCHLAVYYPEHEVGEQMAKLRRLAEAGRTNRRPDFDIDAANVERLRVFEGMPVAEVLDIVAKARRTIRAEIGALDDTFLALPVAGTAWGDVVPVGRVVAESTCTHDEGHLDEIVHAVRAHDATVGAILR
ncbi:DinB family protein [Streptomyces sp. BE230]|uniref:DinB family protein n=1 Tax=Streptomyces sp. BE230 TaxID=3002526 RepID=UPI002ED0E0A1|nr:hypothetical protein [Streptomyces sp. BE230]